MYLSKKEVFKNDEENNGILRQMGYSAYKLWNVGNYEKRNYKELGMEKFPDWYEQKKRLKTNFFFKNLPSQTAQDVLKLLEEGWKSFFALKKSGKIENPRPPRYKQGVISITFLKDAIKQIDNKVRLTISSQLKEYLKTIGINANFVYLKTKRFLNINIKEIQIQFLNEKEYIAIAVYKEDDVQIKEDNGRYLSIDLGINNNFTCYDSKGKSFIVNGYMKATHYYDKKISYYQEINSKQQIKKGIRYPKTSKKILKMYTKRRNSVRDFLHKSTRYIADYCKKNEINRVIIGDIKGIRKDKNIGKSNQQLHAFPYEKIYEMLKYKLERMGIKLEKQKESYTSQCAPDSKEVSKKYAQKEKRIKRGLYKDDKKIYNADSVGAYNIMRLYWKKKEKENMKYGDLSSPIKVTV